MSKETNKMSKKKQLTPLLLMVEQLANKKKLQLISLLLQQHLCLRRKKKLNINKLAILLLVRIHNFLTVFTGKTKGKGTFGKVKQGTHEPTGEKVRL